MKSSVIRVIYLTLTCLAVGGCASTPFKPQNLTELQAEQKRNELIYLCQGLRQGAYINLSFYENSGDAHKMKISSGTRKGYFYAFNKLSGTLYMSDKRLTVFDRGEVYPIQFIQSISKLPDDIPQTVMANSATSLLRKVLEVPQNDPEHALLTQ